MMIRMMSQKREALASDEGSGAATAPLPEPWLTTQDALLGGLVRLRQPAKGYRAALDPALLAACIPLASGERALDLGCGTGAASLCLAARLERSDCRDIAIVGLEFSENALALAAANVLDNGMQDRISLRQGDVRAPLWPGASHSFHHVLCNPPFWVKGRHAPASNASKASSHGEMTAGLADFIGCAARALRAKGVLTLICPPERLDDAMAAMAGRFGGIRLHPLWPKAGRPAKRLIVQAKRDSRAPLALCPGLILHEPDGRLSAATEAIVRHAALFPGLDSTP
jgi:tRNA1(Val) A37 N6-methylase TrmN6